MTTFGKARLFLVGLTVFFLLGAILFNSVDLYLPSVILPLLSLVLFFKQRYAFRLGAAAFCAEMDKEGVSHVAGLSELSWLPHSWVVAESQAGWEYAKGKGLTPGSYDDFNKALQI